MKSKNKSAKPVVVPVNVSTNDLNAQIAALKQQAEALTQQHNEAIAAEKLIVTQLREKKIADTLAILGATTVAAAILELKSLARAGSDSKRGNKISDETKALIDVALASPGNRTSAQIAETFSVSLPFLQLRKKALGLTRTNAKRAVAA